MATPALLAYARGASRVGTAQPKAPSMNGRRVYPDEQGNLTLRERDYGKDGCGVWCVRPPGCHAGGIPLHDVVEHEDGTITVSPSILLDDGEHKWHGYLERGAWREV
jgi:hypothetical protein